MRAFVIDHRGHGFVDDVESPLAGVGQAVIDVTRVGICGTDVGLFNADDARIARARTTFPLRLGHEWTGVVVQVGADVDPAWIGRRVVGDTMIGCARCESCERGDHHVCADRIEVGVRGGWSGAFAEQLLMPVGSLHAIPDSVSDEAGALIEPAANAVRAVRAAFPTHSGRLLVIGPGTIGLLAAQVAAASGSRVTVLGRRESSLSLPRDLGLSATSDVDDVMTQTWDAVIEATSSPDMPRVALETVRPAGRVVLVGVSAEPSLVDTRTAVHKDVSIFGILGGSQGIPDAIEAFASGSIDPSSLVGDTISLDALDDELAGRRTRSDGIHPKVLVDPSLPASHLEL